MFSLGSRGLGLGFWASGSGIAGLLRFSCLKRRSYRVCQGFKFRARALKPLSGGRTISAGIVYAPRNRGY